MEYCIMFSQQLSSLWFIWLNPISSEFQMTYSVLSCVMWLGRGQSGLWGSFGKYWHNPGWHWKIIFTSWFLSTLCLQMSLTELLFAVAWPLSICIAKHFGNLCLILGFWKHLVYFWEIFTASCISHFLPHSWQYLFIYGTDMSWGLTLCQALGSVLNIQ